MLATAVRVDQFLASIISSSARCRRALATRQAIVSSVISGFISFFCCLIQR
jgi:hypothetical protein